MTDKEDQGAEFEELRTFVSGSLRAIMAGISDAQADATLNSPFGSGVHAYNAPKEVAFDIAVSAERSKSGKGGFSLKVLSVGAGAEGEASGTESTATRLQFTVRTEFKHKDAGKRLPSPKTGIV